MGSKLFVALTIGPPTKKWLTLYLINPNQSKINPTINKENKPDWNQICLQLSFGIYGRMAFKIYITFSSRPDSNRLNFLENAQLSWKTPETPDHDMCYNNIPDLVLQNPWNFRKRVPWQGFAPWAVTGVGLVVGEALLQASARPESTGPLQ